MKRSDQKNAANLQTQMLNEMKSNVAGILFQHPLISICTVAVAVAATKGIFKLY